MPENADPISDPKNGPLNSAPSRRVDPRRVSDVFEAPDLAQPGFVLSAKEREFFIEHGFLIKPQLVSDKLLKPAMDHIWSHLLQVVPVHPDTDWRLSRDDRSTWVNPQWAVMPPHPESGPYQGRQPVEYQGRIVKMHDIGAEEFLLQLLPRNEHVVAVAQALLSRSLRPISRTRGVYPVFPSRDATDPSGTRRISGRALGPHTDQVCQQLNACLYLEDVHARSGGFTVYPGSHRRLFQAHTHESNYSPLPNYDETVRSVVQDTTPLELVAPRGSVIFWHGRLLHSAGIHVGDDIRWAAFADFTEDRLVLDDDEHRRLGQFEWFKDAKLFSDDAPVTTDMWRHWRLVCE